MIQAHSARTLGVIPARFASTRLPGKPLHLIAGKPLLQWVIEGASDSKLLKEIIVATDHQGIMELANSLGVKAVMTSEACATGTDRCFEATRDEEFDAVVNIQGDEPLISGKVVDKVIEGLFDPSASSDMATLVTALDESELGSPGSVKAIVDQNGHAIYFSRCAIPYTKASLSDFPDLALKHMGIYAYKRQALERLCAQSPTTLEKAESLEQLRALWLGFKIKVVKVEHMSIGVDTPDDVKLVEKYLLSKK